MPYYMLQAAYTGEACAAQASNPQNRVEQLRPVIEGLGGTIESAFYSFGEYDAVLIAQYPDNVSAAPFAVAASAAGALKAVKTTPLMTVEEGVETMRRAGATGWLASGQAKRRLRQATAGLRGADRAA